MELLWVALFTGLVVGIFGLVAACERLLGKPPASRQSNGASS
jgi:hypothetical protein